MNVLKKRKVMQAIFATCFMALGIALMFFPDQTEVLLCYILGAIMICAGIVKIVFYFLIAPDMRTTTDFVFGLAFIIIGVLAAAFAHYIVSFYYVVIALALIILACQKLGYSLELRGMKVRTWGLNLAEAIVPALFGIAIFVVANITIDLSVAFVTGAAFIVESILSLVSILYLEHKIKTIKEEIKKVKNKEEQPQQIKPE